MIAAKTSNQDAGVFALRFSQLMNRKMVLTARRRAGEWISAFKKAQAHVQNYRSRALSDQMESFDREGL